MLLNDLALVIRGAGLTVTEVGNWRAHNHGGLASVEAIIIHHTAGGATGDYPSLNTVRFGRPDLAGPLAQLGIGRSGRAYVFSSGVAYHAGTVKAAWQDNQHSIGIEVESVGTGPAWPAVQVNAAARATAALCRRYGVPVARVLGHKEVCSPPGRKVDPVGIPGGMPAFRTLVQQYLTGDVMDAQQYAVLVETQKRVTLAKATIEQVKVLVDQAEALATAARNEATNAKVAANGANAKLDELSAKVDGLGTGGVDTDAVAAQVAAVLAPVLAGLVADEVARRMAS